MSRSSAADRFSTIANDAIELIASVSMPGAAILGAGAGALAGQEVERSNCR
jgi:hypothetical protein